MSIGVFDGLWVGFEVFEVIRNPRNVRTTLRARVNARDKTADQKMAKVHSDTSLRPAIVESAFSTTIPRTMNLC